MPLGLYRKYKEKYGDGKVHVNITNIITLRMLLGQEYRYSVFGYAKTQQTRRLEVLNLFAIIWMCRISCALS